MSAALAVVMVVTALGAEAGAATVAPGPSITSTHLATALLGSDYSASLQAAGGTAPLTWSLASGAVPIGLVLSSTGVLAGRPGSLGTNSIAVQVTDALGLSATATVSFTVRAPPPPPQLIAAVTSAGSVALGANDATSRLVVGEASPGAIGVAAANGGAGFWTVDQAGRVTVIGATASFGSVGRRAVFGKIVGIAAPATGGGYWIASSTGHVYGFGAAHSEGSVPSGALRGRVVAISPASEGDGYLLLSSSGQVFSFGSAPSGGSVRAARAHVRVVGVAAATGSAGYWVATATGRVYAFGAVRNDRLSGPTTTGRIVAIAVSPTGVGYFLVNAAGEVFAYGAAAAPLSPLPTGSEAVTGVVATA